MESKKCFLLDFNRCTGCGACVIACTLENQGKKEKNWRQVYAFNESHHPDLPFFHLSMACNHCDLPACQTHCPALAITKDPRTGAVIIDQELCLGCKYCTWACPYDAPHFNSEKGVAEKCDFCNSRLLEGIDPACVSACPTNALTLDNFDESESTQSIAGFSDTGIKPAIRFKGLEQTKVVPTCTARPSANALTKLFKPSQKSPPAKISLKSEWSLLVFTSIAYIMVSLLAALLVGKMQLNPAIFIGMGSFALGVSLSHLGKKFRSWRAILNVWRSWLSREIVVFMLFFSGTSIYLLLFPEFEGLGWGMLATGFIGLLFIDRIYQVAMQAGPLNFHSAHVFLNGLFLASILTGFYLISFIMGLLKFCLYLSRKLHFKKTKKPLKPFLSLLRITLGFLLPGAILGFLADVNSNWVWIVAACVIGAELVDRMEYYEELDIITPPKKIISDLEELLATIKS